MDSQISVQVIWTSGSHIAFGTFERDYDERPTLPSTDPTAGALPTEVLQATASMFGLLSATVRLHILWLLSQSDCDVGTLADETEESVATVSHHLGKLKVAGLVRDRRHGKHRVYSVADNHVVGIVLSAVDTQLAIAHPTPRIERIPG
ncbi:MAG: metalloregulator ArsR/SmtB family transcription factor [Mycobacterium sp.]|nr:metalloregulator ArsR/SmtB family transcription factor [Mycobacterium sp.]